MGNNRNHHCFRNNRNSNRRQDYPHSRNRDVRHSLKVQLKTSSRPIHRGSPDQHVITRRSDNFQRTTERAIPRLSTRISHRRSRSCESYTRTVSMTNNSSNSNQRDFRRNDKKIRESQVPITIGNDGFTVSIKIGDKHLNSSVNSHRKVTLVNRSVFKLLNWNVCPANYDTVSIPISAGTKTLEILCVANYQLNVPVILGRDATNQFGFRLSIVEDISNETDVLDLNSKQDENDIKNM